MSIPSPSIGGIALVDGMYVCGSAFELSSKATETASVPLADGWTVDTVASHKLVVARSANIIGPSQLVDAALEAAHKGLDLLSITGHGDTRIDDGPNTYVAWRKPNNRLKVTVYVISHLSTRTGPVTLMSYSPTGELIPSPEPKEPQWRDSYRFFRYAQTTDNIAEAYRSMFLALESALSAAIPPFSIQNIPLWRKVIALLRPQGRTRTAEGEEAWLLRALRKAEEDGVQLQRVCPSQAANHPKWLVKHLYRDARHSLFHAKQGRRVMLPTPAASELPLLTDHLKTLTELYLMVIEHYDGVRRPGGAVFSSVFRNAQSQFAGKPVFLVNDDSPIDASDDTISPAGKPIFRFGTSVPYPGTDDRFLIRVATSVRWPKSPPINAIRRIVLAEDDQTPLLGVLLEGDLVLEPGAVLEIINGVRILNEQRVKYRFKT